MSDDVKEKTMASERDLAIALLRAVETPSITPSYDSADGLPANASQLERVDDELLEVVWLVRNRFSYQEFLDALPSARAFVDDERRYPAARRGGQQ